MTNDDWRLQVDFEEQRHLAHMVDRLEAADLEHDLSTEYGDRVVVSRDGDTVFLYAGSRERSEQARTLIEQLARKHEWRLTTDLKRWHPVAEEWEDPDKALPTGATATAAEREELMAGERREAANGHPEFEVRVKFPSRHEAVRADEKLRDEGIPTVRRFNFLLLGAADEDSAKEIAEQLRTKVAADARISVEGTWELAYGERPHNPFAIFGGLGA